MIPGCRVSNRFDWCRQPVRCEPPGQAGPENRQRRGKEEKREPAGFPAGPKVFCGGFYLAFFMGEMAMAVTMSTMPTKAVAPKNIQAVFMPPAVARKALIMGAQRA